MKGNHVGIESPLNRTFNILNLFLSMFVFGTGLILFLQFHIGDGAHQKEWLSLGKNFWLNIHRASAIGFLMGCAAHIQMHWRYIKVVVRRWRVNLPKKIRSRSREQILLFIPVALFPAACGNRSMT